MSRVTLKSQAIVIAQLEAQVAELSTQVGVLMSQLEASNQRGKLLSNERDDLIVENQRLVDSCGAAHERCDALEAIVAAQPKTAPPASPKKPAPKPQVPATPVASPEAQEAMAMFLKLTPQQRSVVIKHAQVKVVNLGNVLEVQAKWHSRKSA